MISYDIFKKAFLAALPDYLPADMKNMGIHVETVRKNNQVMKELCLLVPDKEGLFACPRICLNDLYQSYLCCENLGKIMNGAVAELKEGFSCADGILQTSQDVENGVLLEKRIVFQLVNTEKNRELLSEIPHREFLDLSIIYRVIYQFHEKGFYSGIIDHAFAERHGLSEERLYRLAYENTRQLFPPVKMDILDVIGYLERKELPGETTPVTPDCIMLVISNQTFIKGAATILYEDVLQEVAGLFEDDLFLIPSTVNEILAVRASDCEPEFLSMLVPEINREEVAATERLSDNFYYYDRNVRKISLASECRLQTFPA